MRGGLVRKAILSKSNLNKERDVLLGRGCTAPYQAYIVQDIGREKTQTKVMNVLVEILGNQVIGLTELQKELIGEAEKFDRAKPVTLENI